jgi:sulfite reductase alpha subunit-like flavoprotein
LRANRVRSEQRVHCALHVTRNEELRLAGGPMQRSTKLIQLELADADARYAPADNLYVCATNSREAVRAAAEQFGYAAAAPPTSAPGLDRRAHIHLRRELGLRAVRRSRRGSQRARWVTPARRRVRCRSRGGRGGLARQGGEGVGMIL